MRWLLERGSSNSEHWTGICGDLSVTGFISYSFIIIYDMISCNIFIPDRDYPHITIYHPNDGNHFANVGWSGWVGSLTGKLFTDTSYELTLYVKV